MSNLTSIRNIMNSRKGGTGYDLPEAIEKGSLHEVYEFQSSLVDEMISAGTPAVLGGSNSPLPKAVVLNIFNAGCVIPLCFVPEAARQLDVVMAGLERYLCQEPIDN